jgi:hypothetical protein
MVMYDLARLKMADDLRWAERERLVREAGSSRSTHPIDAVPFLDRLVRLFGIARPTAGGHLAAGA